MIIILCEEQCGFRKKRSCQDHIFTLFNILENRKLCKKDTYTCFVDFKKAFDSIPRDKLWHKLKRIEVNGHFLNIIQRLYSKTQYSVYLENASTDWFTVNSGVKQGCTLSPTLFNIYINDLVDYLKSSTAGSLNVGKVNLDCLLYADDLVIIADCPNTLQEKLHCLTQFCDDWSLSINPQKTKIVHFRNNRKRLDPTRFTCCNSVISYAANYKYLGIIFNEHLSWKSAIEAISTSVSRAASLIICKYRSCGGFNYKIYSRLYECLILPIVNYSSFLWGFKSYPEINKMQYKLIRNFLALNKNTPLEALIGEMGWKPISFTTEISCIKYWKHLCQLPDFRITRLIFNESCRLADDGLQNWVHSIRKLLTTNLPNDPPLITHDLNSIIKLFSEYTVCYMKRDGFII